MGKQEAFEGGARVEGKAGENAWAAGPRRTLTGPLSPEEEQQVWRWLGELLEPVC